MAQMVFRFCIEGCNWKKIENIPTKCCTKLESEHMCTLLKKYVFVSNYRHGGNESRSCPNNQ
jgi:hypothetical protein